MDSFTPFTLDQMSVSGCVYINQMSTSENGNPAELKVSINRSPYNKRSLYSQKWSQVNTLEELFVRSVSSDNIYFNQQLLCCPSPTANRKPAIKAQSRVVLG